MLKNTRAKIQDAHLSRRAAVYVRQSTKQQVTGNLESQRLQYGLTGLARELGFRQVEVIDDDLGRSGSGSVDRPGFRRLFEAVAAGDVGAVFCLEASRLARNGQDWHALLEACAFVGSLIISPDGIADPNDGNDRLLLGLKGTLSEYELTLWQQRGQEARRAKAARGEYQCLLPIGYRWEQNCVVMDPDQRVRDAIVFVFSKFAELQSIRQTHKWFCHEEFELPAICYRKGQAPSVQWRSPAYGVIQRFIKNAVYAGAYVAGKTKYKLEFVGGRKQKRSAGQLPREQWRVLIRDHHPAYISWDVFEQNQITLEGNNYRMAEASKRRGRGGRALLAGLFRCARCGRKLHVAYSGHGGSVVRYQCVNGKMGYGLGRCLSFGGQAVDEHLSDLMLEAISPRAVEAAQKAVRELRKRLDERRQVLENELEQAAYETRLAQRRYEAVDPENRLVASRLEQAWDDALQRAKTLERQVEETRSNVLAQQRHQTQRLWDLANDFVAVWEAPETDMQLKQRIIQILVEDIVVDIDDGANEVVAVIHWTGGRHTEARIPRRKSGRSYRATPDDVIAILRSMDKRWTDDEAAALLNRIGTRTGTGKVWTRTRVRHVRVSRKIPPHDPEHAVHYVNLKQAAKQLGVSTSAIRTLIGRKLLPALQVAPTARWEIRRDQLDKHDIQTYVAALKAGNRPRIESRVSENLSIPGLWQGDSA